jgi:hypothetical protein
MSARNFYALDKQIEGVNSEIAKRTSQLKTLNAKFVYGAAHKTIEAQLMAMKSHRNELCDKRKRQ